MTSLSPNRLINETSPYLLQHASNLVDWYPWGEEALARAAAEDKPILVSIGYAACHWCRAMEEESFSDPEVADIMNERFISIKVDREEHPDVDALYVDAVQTMTGSAGWPLTVFLTPTGAPFYGGGYLPPEPRSGLASFRQVLDAAWSIWRTSRQDVDEQAKRVLGQIESRADLLPEKAPLSELLWEQGIFSIIQSFDTEHGGFGEAPKFAQPWLIELMLRADHHAPGRPGEVADVTMRRISRGGVYDQIGGGFHRYTEDRAWRIPHFEKMLYDNASLARLYTRGWQARRDPLLARIATETLEYLINDLKDSDGGFYSSEYADSEGEGEGEGAFYLWSYEELASLAPEAVEHYGVTREGNFEGLNVLTASADEPPAAARAKLSEARSKRARPGRDEKIVTAWNGLAISALAEAGAALKRPDLLEAATQTASFCLERLIDPSGRLQRCFKDGRTTGAAVLEDYAYLAEGLFTLWEATFEPRWIEACERLCREMLELFWDPSQGALNMSGHDQPQLVLSRTELTENLTPSPNGVASLLLQRLGHLMGDGELTRRGEEILRAGQPFMQTLPTDTGTLLAAFDFYLSGPKGIAILGDRSLPETAALLDEIWTRFIPNRVLAGAPGGLPASLASPLLDGKELLEGRPTAFVCEGYACKAPTTDPEELARSLRESRAPSPAQVAEAARLIGAPLQHAHFFQQLSNPRWIRPLAEKGFFNDPPAPIHEYMPGATGSPPWPESQYLVRMAAKDPSAVHGVALDIPDTDNGLVQEDLASLALALPPYLAEDFVPRAKSWLGSSSNHLLLPEKLGALMGHLARGGREAAALDLAGCLLEVFADPNEAGREPDEGFRRPPEPQSRFSTWEYGQIVKSNVEDLARAGGWKTLELFCNLLDSALRFSQPSDRTGESARDHSYLWRPAIEPNEGNLDRSLRDPLLSAVRDAAEHVLRTDPSSLPAVVEVLESRPWPVFIRVALHVLRLFGDRTPALVEEHLSNRTLFGDPHFHHEYLFLAMNHFARLWPQDRHRILGWIEAGPDLDLWKDVPELWASSGSSQKIERYAREWKAKRLAILSQPLPGGSQAPPEQPEFVSPPQAPPQDLTTPKQAPWIRSASMEELVELLNAWRSPGGIGTPTVAGLQRKLTEVVASEPGRFSENAPALRNLRPAYLGAIAAGLRQAVRGGVAFSWRPVLELYREMASRSQEPPQDSSASGWITAAREATRLLAAGFGQGQSQIPIELRSLVWEILLPLTGVPDPGERRRREAGAGGGSIASLRADATAAAVRYALWIRRHLELSPGGAERIRRGFDEMPEVRRVLEAQLDPTLDEAPALRAVYGAWFGWLLLLDAQWMKARVHILFPEDKTHQHLRTSAWDAYLSFSPSYDHVFELLEPDYDLAVDRIAELDLPAGGAGPDRQAQRLAEHLITLYVRRRISLDDPSGLLARFFANASVSLRAYALEHVGRLLQTQGGPIPAEVLGALMRLWENRLTAASAAADAAPSDRGDPAELASFGTWFASGKLQDSWALDQLISLLRLPAGVTATKQVVERLRTVSVSMPARAVESLGHLVRQESQGIRILGWSQEASAMLAAVAGGDDPEARRAALDLLEVFDLNRIEELIL